MSYTVIIGGIAYKAVVENGFITLYTYGKKSRQMAQCKDTKNARRMLGIDR